MYVEEIGWRAIWDFSVLSLKLTENLLFQDQKLKKRKKEKKKGKTIPVKPRKKNKSGSAQENMKCPEIHIKKRNWTAIFPNMTILNVQIPSPTTTLNYQQKNQHIREQGLANFSHSQLQLSIFVNTNLLKWTQTTKNQLLTLDIVIL